MTLLELLLIALLPSLGITGYLLFIQIPIVWVWIESFGMPAILEWASMAFLLINGVPAITGIIALMFVVLMMVVILIVSAVSELFKTVTSARKADKSEEA